MLELLWHVATALHLSLGTYELEHQVGQLLEAHIIRSYLVDSAQLLLAREEISLNSVHNQLTCLLVQCLSGAVTQWTANEALVVGNHTSDELFPVTIKSS